MARFSKLDTLSGRLFFSGIILSRLSNVPVPILKHLLFVLSSLLYLSAYAIWNTSVHEDEKERWNFKHKVKEEFDRLFQHNQYYQLTAITGILACVFSLASLAFPPLALVSAWLFFVSNACWFKAETITLKRLDEDEPNTLLHNAQQQYHQYTGLSTLASFLTPVMLTLVVIFPHAAATITAVMMLYIVATSLFAFAKWFDSGDAFGKITDRTTDIERLREKNDVSPSHQKMLHKMPKGEHETTAQDSTLVQAATPNQPPPSPLTTVLPEQTSFHL